MSADKLHKNVRKKSCISVQTDQDFSLVSLNSLSHSHQHHPKRGIFRLTSQLGLFRERRYSAYDAMKVEKVFK